MIIRKSCKIPARDGATGIPPAGRVETCSRVALRAPRLPTSTGGSRGNLTLNVREHRPVGAKSRHMLPENLSDQIADGSGRIFTQIEVNGRVGLFEFFAFHAQPDSQGR